MPRGVNPTEPLPQSATRQPLQSLLQASARRGRHICQVSPFALQSQEALWRHTAARLRRGEQPARKGAEVQRQGCCPLSQAVSNPQRLQPWRQKSLLHPSPAKGHFFKHHLSFTASG